MANNEMMLEGLKLLGLGMGMSPKELGFKQNLIKPKSLLAKLGL